VNKGQVITGAGGKDDKIGHCMNITCVKNKVAAPYRKCQVNLIYGEGMQETESLVDIMLKLGEVIQVKQGVYTIGEKGDEIKGKANVLKALTVVET
jgi:hypothetical protein